MKDPGLIIFILLMPVAIWALMRTFYMAWFRPSDYLKESAKIVKDWWRDADYYRSHYASSKWLWASRLVSLFFVILVGLMIYHIILGL